MKISLSDVVIRKMVPEDGEAVALLILQLTKNIVKPQELEKRCASQCYDPWSYHIVAEYGGRVIAHGQLTTSSLLSKGRVGRLEEIVTDKEYRKNGIASAICQNLLGLARGIGLAQVELEAANDEAARIYEKLSFIMRNQKPMIVKFYAPAS